MLFEQNGGAEPVLIAQNDNGGDGRNFSIVYNSINPGENTYYIKAEGAVGSRLGLYTLHFDTGPGTPPPFTVATTMSTIREESLLFSLTVATDVNIIDSPVLRVRLTGVQSTPVGTLSLFTQPPTVALTGAVGAQSIVLSGSVANADVNGVWTATVQLSDGVVTERVGVVTISVVQCSDNTLTPCTLSAGEPTVATLHSADDGIGGVWILMMPQQPCVSPSTLQEQRIHVAR